MKNFFDLLDIKKPTSIPEYFQCCKKIRTPRSREITAQWPKIKIAVLTSFTTNGIEEVLTVQCAEQGISAEIYCAPYNQYNQEILNPGSRLYAFEPDLCIIFIDSRTALGNLYYNPYSVNDAERKDRADAITRDLINLITRIKEQTAAKILVHNFEVPDYSPLGILENRQKFGFLASVEYMNTALSEHFRLDSQVFIFDYDAFCSRYGKLSLLDYKLYYLADLRLNMDSLPRLADEYLAYIAPILSKTKKCIVLDLDNTLWGGIIGEDGIDGIQLGPTPAGRSFYEFQKYLLALFNRGVILAINSRNNPDDALLAIRTHPHMVLKEQHFAAIRINWDNKVTNMIAIAKELNIGLDAMVFLDDDQLNREMIAQELSDVLVVDLPGDTTQYVKTLTGLRVFNTLQLTDEDLNKGKMYAEQRQRDEFQKSVRDITEYLKGLEMIVTIERATPFSIPRISQLTQKTNQFNLTTRRYLEEDIRRFSEDKDWLVLGIDVRDKFGDNGITGVMIVKTGKEDWRIDSLLLSCRIIGRNVERVLMAYVISEARKSGAKKITGEFIPTKKNPPAKDFFKDNKFSPVSQDSDRELWEFDLNTPYETPAYIRVITR